MKDRNLTMFLRIGLNIWVRELMGKVNAQRGEGATMY